MKKIFILLLFPIIAQAQVLNLSSSAEIHVVTCGPGQNELYSAFGHSAFRVVDPVNGIDYIYDYGVFDFNQPNFYLNFARGNLNYSVARRDYAPFLNYYAYYNRSFTEQQLNLTTSQKQQLFDYLEWNNLPENRNYSYDYFFNNCATKIRDVIIAALGESIYFDPSHITEEKTIRELTDDYLKYQPWGDLGIDICLGLPMDVDATPEIHLFLPDYVNKAFENAFIKEGENLIPLVKQTFLTYSRIPETVEITFFTPFKIGWFIFLCIAVITYLGYRNGKNYRGLDILFFGILGLLGLFLFLLWVATDHNAAARNLNLLWAMPLHLWALFLLIRKSSKLPLYFRISTFWYLFVSAAWFFLPQLMHPALFPLALAALLRSGFIWKIHIRNDRS